jgi:hypothetical protein
MIIRTKVCHLLRDNERDKRAINNKAISLEEVFDGTDNDIADPEWEEKFEDGLSNDFKKHFL